MVLMMIATAVFIWCAYRIAEAGRGRIVSERATRKLDPIQQPPMRRDPFASHPMHCKCVHHR